jgi:hypothetical protein
MAALKMCMDRVLPVSYFEKDKNGASKGGINITITGVGGETTIVGNNNSDDEGIIEGEYEDVGSKEN